MEKFEKKPLNKVIRGANRAVYDKTEIYNIIDDGFMCYVSYVYEGQAICLPMAYARIDNEIYIHGSLKNRMLLALLNSENASLLFMHLDGLVLARSAFHHSVNYRSVTVFGKVKKIEDTELKTKALVAVVNTMVPDRWDSLRPMTEKELNSTLVISVSIDVASAKVRAEGAIDEKSDLELPVWAGIVPIKQVAKAPESDALLDVETTIPQHVLDYCEQHKD